MTPKPKVLIATAVVAVLLGAGIWAYQWIAAGSLSADPTDAALVKLGQAQYAIHCASCHGPKLEGEPNWRQRRPDGTLPSPPHDETGHTWHHADKILFDITKYGGQRNAPPGFTSRMPGFGDKLDDREIYAVLAYIKSRWPAEVRRRQDMIDSRSR